MIQSAIRPTPFLPRRLCRILQVITASAVAPSTQYPSSHGAPRGRSKKRNGLTGITSEDSSASARCGIAIKYPTGSRSGSNMTELFAPYPPRM